MTKRYGLKEARALVQRRPGLTPEDLELIRVFAEDCLGYKNVVPAEADELRTLLDTKVQKERVLVDELRVAISEAEAQITTKLIRIEETEKLKRLFGN